MKSFREFLAEWTRDVVTSGTRGWDIPALKIHTNPSKAEFNNMMTDSYKKYGNGAGGLRGWADDKGNVHLWPGYEALHDDAMETIPLRGGYEFGGKQTEGNVAVHKFSLTKDGLYAHEPEAQVALVNHPRLKKLYGGTVPNLSP